jgi:hypothetical protein
MKMLIIGIIVAKAEINTVSKSGLNNNFEFNPQDKYVNVLSTITTKTLVIPIIDILTHLFFTAKIFIMII